jgi:hypothetical protein
LNGTVSLNDWASVVGIKTMENYSTPTTESSDSNAWANVAQSVIDIPMNLGKLPFNLIDK